MKKRSTETVEIWDELAEGSNDQEIHEPTSPIHTSTFPRFVDNSASNNRSETGLNHVVVASNEDENLANDADSPDTTSDISDTTNEKTVEKSSEKEV